MTVLDALGSPLQLPAEGDKPRPQVGEAWVVSTEGQDRGLVVVSAVREMHVLAWPVTNPSPDAAAPAFRLRVAGMGEMVAWPDAEFGLSMAALDRRLGSVLNDRIMREIRWAVTEDETVAGIDWCPTSETPEAEAAFEAVCWQAWDLGAWHWPNAHAGIGVLDTDVLRENDLDSHRLAEVLGTPPGRVSALVRGLKVPNPHEIDAVLGLLRDDLSADDLLTSVSGEDAETIALPAFKHGVVELMKVLRTSEEEARTALWERSNQAARQTTHVDPLEAARSRVEFALQQLLEENR